VLTDPLSRTAEEKIIKKENHAALFNGDRNSFIDFIVCQTNSSSAFREHISM
jgi:hypothetical protein